MSILISFLAVSVITSVCGILYKRNLEKKYPQVRRSKKTDPILHVTSEGILDEVHQND
jgi:CBS-domain-containing membrane protein